MIEELLRYNEKTDGQQYMDMTFSALLLI